MLREWYCMGETKKTIGNDLLDAIYGGVDRMRVFDASSVDLVLLDYNMPEEIRRFLSTQKTCAEDQAAA